MDVNTSDITILSSLRKGGRKQAALYLMCNAKNQVLMSRALAACTSLVAAEAVEAVAAEVVGAAER